MRGNMDNSIHLLSSTQHIDNFDLFVASQQDKYVYDKFDSCYLDGDSLFNVLMQRVIELQDFKSAAYMQSSDFSLYDHNHDSLYNKLSIELEYASYNTFQNFTLSSSLSSCISFNNVIDDDDALSIGNMFIDGSLIPVEVPISFASSVKKVSFTAVEPLVGSLKFVASSSIRSNNDILYRSNDFDGWLYPDGSTFNLSDFVLSNDIAKLYRSSSTAFTLPDLRNFVRANGKNEKGGTRSSAIGLIQKKNVLKKHVHNLNIECDVDVSFILTVVANPDFSVSTIGKNYGTFHLGQGNVRIDGDSTVNRSSSPVIQYKNANNEITKMTFDKIVNLTKDIFHLKNSINSFSLFDNAENFLSSIDKYNGSNLCEQFINYNTLKLNPVDTIQLTATIANINNMSIDTAGSSTDETYPTHIILPVMIYVGQRRRNLA